MSKILEKTMDQRSPVWKIRSTEKTLSTDRKANNSFISNEEETEVREFLTEKLSSALSECSSKDHIAKKQVKIAQEAIAGLEKAETEAISLKNDLDKALQQKAACEERLIHLDTALKECTQQLHFVRNEQEKRVHSAVMKTSQEIEKTKIALEERLAEAGKRIARLDAENTQFKKSLLKKDKVVEELSIYRSQVEADLKALILRLESTEKENASLKYEVRVLERELEIRHEEREFNRRTTDAAQKQHQESVEKIAKLESECQRLRSLVRKRLPGPAALTRMKNEVERLGKDQFETRRGKSNHIDFLTEQLQKMEEENRRLKHALNRKSSELQLSKAPKTIERGKYPFFMQEHSPATLSDMGSEEKASCAESWASALISELEHFKNEKKSGTPSHRYMGTPDMNLMDDFAEMEKFAYSPAVNGHVSQTSENNALNLEAYDTGNENNISTAKKGDQKSQSYVSIPIKKILELLEGISINSQDKLLPCNDSATLTGHMVRVFRCETAEFSAVLQQFVQTCNDLSTGKADLEQFAISVASNMEWIMNHCFSLQDVSSTKDYGGSANHSAESNKSNILTEDTRYLQPNSEEEDKGLNFKLAIKGSSVADLEGRLRSQNEKVELFKIQLQDSKDIIENSESQVPTMRQSEDNIGDQTEEQKMMKQDIETQLMKTNPECRKPCEVISHKSFKEPVEPCNDLKTQLEGETSKEAQDDGKQLQDDQEITSASEKLAECQETLRNLGKQLKALASPRDAALFDKVVSTSADHVITSVSTPQRNGSQRLSLLDKMLAEDNNVQIGASPRTKDATQNGHDNSDVTTNAAIESWSKFTDLNQIDRDADRKAVVSMAIVPRKKKDGRSFLKKLIWWQKKGNSKKTHFS